MRVGPFEVTLQVKDETLPETVIGQKSYAHAISGNEYSIKIEVYRDDQESFPASHMRIGVYVDGQDVQYWKRLDTTISSAKSVCCFFHGFKKGSDDLRAFVFEPPVESQSASADIESSVGSIRVEIFEAVPAEGIFHNVGRKYEVPGKQQLPVDSKFHKTPSVTTVGGRNVSSMEKFAPLVRWVNKDPKSPLAVLVLHYHSSALIEYLRFQQEGTQDQSTEGDGKRRSFGNDNGDHPEGKRTRVSSETGPIFVDLITDDDNDDDIHSREKTTDQQELHQSKISKESMPDPSSNDDEVEYVQVVKERVVVAIDDEDEEGEGLDHDHEAVADDGSRVVVEAGSSNSGSGSDDN